jgi:hypothetical protein
MQKIFRQVLVLRIVKLHFAIECNGDNIHDSILNHLFLGMCTIVPWTVDWECRLIFLVVPPPPINHYFHCEAISRNF